MSLRQYFFGSLFLLFAFLLIEVSVQKKMMLVLNPPNRLEHPSQKTESSNRVSKISGSTSWAAGLTQVLNNSGSITEEELILFAQELSDPNDFKFLTETLKNENLGLQKISLIIEILSLKGTAESLRILQEYSLSQNSVTTDEDVIAKTQAIDGISASSNKSLALEILNDISKRSDSSFLTDRALRAKANISEESLKTE